MKKKNVVEISEHEYSILLECFIARSKELRTKSGITRNDSLRTTYQMRIAEIADLKVNLAKQMWG